MPAPSVQTLLDANPEIELALVIDPEGAILDLAPSTDGAESLAGLAAPLLTTLTGLSDRTVRELGRGGLDLLVLRGPNGHVLASELDDGRQVLVVARPSVRLGVLLDDVSALAGSLNRAAA